MALFELLFSILLFSLVYSAPVEVSTGTTNGGHDPVATISDIEKDAKPSTKPDVLVSSHGALTSLPTEQSDLPIENNESESLKPSDFVPTAVSNEEQTISQFPTDVLPLERHPNPILDPKVVSQAPEDEEQGTEDENIHEEESNPEIDPPVVDVNQQEAVKSPGDVDGDIRESDQQAEDSRMNDKIPILDSNPFDTGMKDTVTVLEESDGPPQVSDRDETPSNISPPQEPYDDRLLDQTPETFDGEVANDGSPLYPQSPNNAESTNQKKIIPQPPYLPPEDDTTKQITPESFTEIQNEPQNNDRLNSDGVPIESEPSQVEDKGPTEIVQPEDVGPSFESYDDPTIESEDDTSLPTPDQSDSPDEQEGNSPGPSFPMNVDAPEEMVGDPVELPMREEAEPPVILVRDDLAPPMLPVIQIEQQVPQYGNGEIVPLSHDSAKGETPEEEISNSENPEPEILNFDNRPEESGPMNIL